ncbi:winged helix-turn-helix domain-containing protein [Curtobacterium flaccumfaciens]|nr:winged helix-turn-helix domain-containing protein [Curtobacterium flaccumfaciens]
MSTLPNGAIGSTPGMLRLINSRAILDELFRDDGSHTVTELSRVVGLSRPTVEAALADLVEEGWVTEAEAIATPNKAGRRAKRFRADAAAGAVLGVDLGLHGIVGVRSDLRGAVTARVEETYADLASAEQAWASVQDVVRRLTDGVDADRLLAATFGVPAVVDRSGEIDYTVAVPQWVERRVPGRIGTSSRGRHLLRQRRQARRHRRGDVGAVPRRAGRPVPGDGTPDRRRLPRRRGPRARCARGGR